MHTTPFARQILRIVSFDSSKELIQVSFLTVHEPSNTKGLGNRNRMRSKRTNECTLRHAPTTAVRRARTRTHMTREDADDGADAALDRVVLRYLHRRGYRNAAGVLQTEARLAQALPGATANDSTRTKVDLSSGMSVAHAMGADAAMSDHLLYHSEAERDPATTVSGYGALRDWAQHSLDLYKVRETRACLFSF